MLTPKTLGEGKEMDVNEILDAISKQEATNGAALLVNLSTCVSSELEVSKIGVQRSCQFHQYDEFASLVPRFWIWILKE